MRQSRPDEVAAGDAVSDEVVLGGRSAKLSFDDFYQREFSGLVVLARSLCGTAIAEEVAQEAMLVVYRRWGSASDLHHPEAWARRVCANLAVSQVRRRAIEARALVRLAWQPAAAAEQPVDDEFWREVRRLPRRQAQAVALRYAFDLGVPEIGQTLECSEGTVKQHLSRARRRLSERLGLSIGSPE
jgi:RNA polymerase sigma-70 factor (ECF subfamily)